MTTIAMLRVHVTLFAIIGATWWNLSACDDTIGAGGVGDISTGGHTGHAGGSATDGEATGGGGLGSPSAAPHWTIHAVDSGGPGCPDLGMGDVSYDAAAGTLKIQYSTMSLSYAAGGAAIQHTNCVAALSLVLHPGWRMAVAGIAAHGSAKLGGGAEGRQTTRTFFAGTGMESGAGVSLGGPYQGAYHEEKAISDGEQVWSSCGGPTIFSVDAGLRLQVPPGSHDMAGIRLQEVMVEVRWRPC